MIAKELKVKENDKGVKKVFKLDPPLKSKDWDTGEDNDYIFVMASGIHLAFDHGGPETYIFPCTSEGGVIDYCELEGSKRGFCDPDKVITDLGYRIEK